MSEFATRSLPAERTVAAPDGSDVRVLLGLGSGTMAHFTLAPGLCSRAVAHRTVEEIWYILSGRGQMWRKQREREEVVELSAGVCLSIPLGTHFQFRACGDEALCAVAITMPPWPGDDEAFAVEGPWPASPTR